jgi:hypothetical protein
MDIGHRNLYLAYAATIGIHLIYVTYVAIKFRAAKARARLTGQK